MRSPKVYIADSGILHALLGLTERTDVVSHPKVGAEAPRLTRSMRSAMDTLNLDSLDVVHAGTEQYLLASGVRALPASELEGTLREMGGRWNEDFPPLIRILEIDPIQMRRHRRAAGPKEQAGGPT